MREIMVYVILFAMSGIAVLLANIALTAINLKLYTEFTKQRMQESRNSTTKGE